MRRKNERSKHKSWDHEDNTWEVVHIATTPSIITLVFEIRKTPNGKNGSNEKTDRQRGGGEGEEGGEEGEEGEEGG